MGKGQTFPGDFDMRKAMELAGSPAGPQLLALLQNQSGPELQQAMDRAAAGDYDSARAALSTMMERPEVRKLLKQLEGNDGGIGR